MTHFFKSCLVFCLSLLPVVAMADMTDSQIMKYLADAKSKGTSQSEMIQHLLSNGVSPQRLQSLQKKYGKLKEQGNGGTGSDVASRSRQNNAEVRSSRSSASNGKILGAPVKGRFETDSPDYMAMQSAMDGLQSDSTQMMMFEEEEPIKVFGRDIFYNENISFEPNMNIATPGNYVLGAGDHVFIDVYGASQATFDGEISPDGYVSIEDFGPVQIGGMTVMHAQKVLNRKLGSRFADSRILLTVGQTRTIQVNVMGEVLVPGTYTLSAFASIFHALYSAGGVNDLGSLRTVKLFRNNQLVQAVDMYDYILNGQLSGDIRLQDNDVIVVAPYEALVNVTGRAKRPMYYEMKPTETVGQLLQYAGGYAAGAYTRSMRLNRIEGGYRQVINIDDSNLSTVTVCDGDELYIDSTLVRYQNMVELRGAVAHPGMYQLSEGTRTVRQMIDYAGGLSEEAFTNRAVIHRMRPNRTLEVVRLNLRAILDGVAADVTLANEDVLFVPSLQTSQENQTLSIYGAVYEPGIYPFAYNTTIEDLVLQAGGLTEMASTSNVFVSRRRNAAKGADQVTSFTFALKDGLLADGDADFVLEPYDQVYVRENADNKAQGSVSIEGEVNFAGHYTLDAQHTRVLDVLNLAGGMTSQAAENGVYVLRKMNEDELRARQKELDARRFGYTYNIDVATNQMNGKPSLPLSDSLLVVRENRYDDYKVAINIKEAQKNPDSQFNLELRDGDRIVVTEKENVVRLSGGVPYPSHVPYVEGKRVAYYLRHGGIPATRRNIKGSYIIHPNGEAVTASRRARVTPGSEVVLRERSSQLTPTQTASIVVSVASTLATMAAVVISVLR